jgi:integrase
MKQPGEGEDGFTPATRHSLEAIVSPTSRGTIERYLNALRTNGRKNRTLELAALHLRGLANEVPKPFAKVSRQDLERYLSRMKNEKTGKTAGRATLELRRGTIKQFYRWLLADPKKPKEFPENVAWIRTHRTPKERLAEDMLAKDEVRQMIEAANGTRDKALVATLYETGTRIGEFLSLRIRDVRIKDGGYAIVSLPAESSSLKTGRRQIPIVECLPYLQAWLEAHPSKETPAALLWPSEYGERRDRQIDDTTVLKLVRRLAARADVDKDVTPHLFRHSRATECARRGWNESQMRRYFGWSRSSTMPSLYTHLAAGDVEARILEDNGLKARPDPIADPLAPLVCGRCGRRNPATVVYCLNCAAIVSVEKALEIERQADTEGRVQAEYLANPAKFQELLNKPEVKMALRILGDAARVQSST